MKKQQGFTAIELAIAIAFILSMIAVGFLGYLVYIGVQELFK